MNTKMLEEKAREIRLLAIDMIAKAGSGHPGGSLSATDILVALYYSKLRLYKDPTDERRDRFVLSKGHSNPPLYAILADKGYINKDELGNLRQLHSILQGHPDSNKCPGIDCSTGSLGQGASVASGMALGLRMKNSDSKVYVMCGDGELDEGICWEGFMSAVHYHLDNYVLIIDRNRLQIDGNTEDVMAQGDLESKFKAFGFDVDVIDGHNFDEILAALDKESIGKPHCIIANTIKGKGVSFMENQAGWHGNAPKGEDYENARKQLGGK